MDDPDWMNDFQTPTEDVLLHLSSSSPSSSPSREVKGKFVGIDEDFSVSNGKDGSDDEDSPLISVLRDCRTAKKGGRGSKGPTPKEMEKSPVKQASKIVRKGALEHEDDEEESPKVESRRPRSNKRKKALESEEEDDDEEYQIPSKVRKTSASPQVKATPKSARKGRRVSFSEEEGTPQVKRLKMEVPLGDPVAISEEDDETQPISSLVRKKDKGPIAAATISTSPSVGGDDFKISAVPKESRGTTALAALRESGGTTADGEDALLTKEEAQHKEVTGDVSEQKGKPRTSVNLPVIFAEKVHRTKVLVECEGEALDLSGDMGAVGRFSVSSGKEKGEDELFLDLKGIIYRTTIVPSNTFFVVNVGHAEAKLQPDTDQIQDETLVEGTLEGFELDNENDGEPLSTPVTASGPVDSDADEDDSKRKKKTPTKQQKQKKVPSKGGKGSRAKGAGKGATSKKARAKAKGTAKKPSKTKTATAKSGKSKKP